MRPITLQTHPAQITIDHEPEQEVGSPPSAPSAKTPIGPPLPYTARSRTRPPTPREMYATKLGATLPLDTMRGRVQLMTELLPPDDVSSENAQRALADLHIAFNNAMPGLGRVIWQDVKSLRYLMPELVDALGKRPDVADGPDAFRSESELMDLLLATHGNAEGRAYTSGRAAIAVDPIPEGDQVSRGVGGDPRIQLTRPLEGHEELQIKALTVPARTVCGTSDSKRGVRRMFPYYHAFMPSYAADGHHVDLPIAVYGRTPYAHAARVAPEIMEKTTLLAGLVTHDVTAHAIFPNWSFASDAWRTRLEQEGLQPDKTMTVPIEWASIVAHFMAFQCLLLRERKAAVEAESDKRPIRDAMVRQAKDFAELVSGKLHDQVYRSTFKEQKRALANSNPDWSPREIVEEASKEAELEAAANRDYWLQIYFNKNLFFIMSPYEDEDLFELCTQFRCLYRPGTDEAGAPLPPACDPEADPGKFINTRFHGDLWKLMQDWGFLIGPNAEDVPSVEDLLNREGLVIGGFDSYADLIHAEAGMKRNDVHIETPTETLAAWRESDTSPLPAVDEIRDDRTKGTFTESSRHRGLRQSSQPPNQALSVVAALAEIPDGLDMNRAVGEAKMALEALPPPTGSTVKEDPLVQAAATAAAAGFERGAVLNDIEWDLLCSAGATKIIEMPRFLIEPDRPDAMNEQVYGLVVAADDRSIAVHLPEETEPRVFSRGVFERAFRLGVNGARCALLLGKPGENVSPVALESELPETHAPKHIYFVPSA